MKKDTGELTPGPYFKGQDDSRFTIEVKGDVGTRAIAVTGGWAPTNEANADLLCASWDLLQAGLVLMEQYDTSGYMVMGGNLTNRPFLMMRDAIAKARGQS